MCATRKSGAPSMELGLYREVVDRIRASGVDLIINLTTGRAAAFCRARTTQGRSTGHDPDDAATSGSPMWWS